MMLRGAVVASDLEEWVSTPHDPPCPPPPPRGWAGWWNGWGISGATSRTRRHQRRHIIRPPQPRGGPLAPQPADIGGAPEGVRGRQAAAGDGEHRHQRHLLPLPLHHLRLPRPAGPTPTTPPSPRPPGDRLLRVHPRSTNPGWVDPHRPPTYRPRAVCLSRQPTKPANQRGDSEGSMEILFLKRKPRKEARRQGVRRYGDGSSAGVRVPRNFGISNFESFERMHAPDLGRGDSTRSPLPPRHLATPPPTRAPRSTRWWGGWCWWTARGASGRRTPPTTPRSAGRRAPRSTPALRGRGWRGAPERKGEHGGQARS